jgi:cobalt-zinc-cadmium efflux system outer membrane protein
MQVVIEIEEVEMKRTIFIILLAFAAATAMADDLNPEDLNQLIKEAIQNNPEISALRHRVQALEHKIAPASALPDPIVGIGAMNFPITETPLDITKEPMTQIQASYAQKFFARGTLRLQGELAGWDVEISKLSVAEKELVIATLVRKAYLQLFLSVRSLGIVEQNKRILSSFLEISRSKYKSGKGLLQDILKAQVSLSKYDVMITQVRQQISTSKAYLNVILNRNIDSELGTPAANDQLKSLISHSEYLNFAIANRPELLGQETKILKSHTAIDLANSRLLPDYTTKFAYGYRQDRTDFWSAAVSFNLPIRKGSRRHEKIAEAEGMKLVEAAKYQARKNNIAFQIKKSVDLFNRTTDQLRQYNEIIVPQATLSLESSISGYQVGKVDFLSLLNSQKTLFDLELEQLRISVEKEIALVDLDKAIGQIPSNEEIGETDVAK